MTDLTPGELRKLFYASLRTDGVVSTEGLTPSRARRSNKDNDFLRGWGFLERLPDGDYRVTPKARDELAKYHRTGLPPVEKRKR